MIKNFDDFIKENLDSDRDFKFVTETIQKIKNFIRSNKFIKNQDYCNHRISSILSHNKLRNIYDKKAFKIFHKKPFFRNEGDGMFASFIVAFTKKHYYAECVILYELSTPNGKIYFTINDTNICGIFTSHFFDRYFQRVFKTNSIPTGKQRIEVIKDLINGITSQMVGNEPIGITPTKDGKKFIGKFSKGAGLGNIYDDDRIYLLYKTFISNDMLNKMEKEDIESYLDFVEKEKERNPEPKFLKIKK